MVSDFYGSFWLISKESTRKKTDLEVKPAAVLSEVLSSLRDFEE